MGSKWMPPKPGDLFRCKINEHEAVPQVYITRTLDAWYDREIKPLFESAVEMNCWTDGRGQMATSMDITHATHKALLINIQPIKEETAEDLLSEIVQAHEENVKNATTIGGLLQFRGDLFAKAKAFLERRKNGQ